jgi:hypothetical protein
MWNATTDPSTGLSFKLWKRIDLGFVCSNSTTSEGLQSCDEECDKLGGILGKAMVCHAYDIIDRICVKVNLEKTIDGKSDSLVFSGGCYNDVEYAHYTRAKPDVIYKFDHVPMEVRDVNDPYLVWINNDMMVPELEDNSYLITYSYLLLCVALFLFLLACVAFASSRISSNPEKKRLIKR